MPAKKTNRENPVRFPISRPLCATRAEGKQRRTLIRAPHLNVQAYQRPAELTAVAVCITGGDPRFVDRGLTRIECITALNKLTALTELSEMTRMPSAAHQRHFS